MAEIDRYLRFMTENSASDFHLSTGVRPMYRVHGKMVSAKSESAGLFSPEDVSRILGEILLAWHHACIVYTQTVLQCISIRSGLEPVGHP